MVAWYHQLNGHEFEQALGDEGQGSLACCSPIMSQRVRHDLVTEQQQCQSIKEAGTSSVRVITDTLSFGTSSALPCNILGAGLCRMCNDPLGISCGLVPDLVFFFILYTLLFASISRTHSHP